MSFYDQVSQAKFITSQAGGGVFYKQMKTADVNNAIYRRDYDKVLNFARSSDMDYLQDRAYARSEGYAIGMVNGKKVMFVSGSRNMTDWVFNALDDPLPAKAHIVSNRTSKRLTQIAKRENVDLVVGHSRGGMLVAKMDIPNSRKLALDGAIRLAPKNKRNIMNLYQKQPLDKFIAARGTNKKGYRMKRLGRAHFISRDRPGYKAQYGVKYKNRPLYDPRRYLGWKRKVYWDSRA